jgi:hypothetical protein
MLYINEMFRDILAARAFRLRASKVGVGSSEQAVRQALGEPSDIIVDTNEDGTEYLTWRYKGALGQRTDFNIAMVGGKWSAAWTAQYPRGWSEVNDPKG